MTPDDQCGFPLSSDDKTGFWRGTLWTIDDF